MATGIVLHVVEKLYAVVHSNELKEVWSMLGYESQLDELAVTISTIKSVLLDAQSKHQELSNEGCLYIDRLKDAVYDVDDLLDEFNTMAQREKMKKGGNIFKKVRQFFSQTNYFLVAFNMSREIKKLTNKLDKIAKDHRQFGLSDVHVPLKKRNATFSYTSDSYIVGREADKETIVAMLLGDSDSMNGVGGNVSFVSVIGMGGLGKTALAQLVYNDCRIEETFDYRSWVCISEDFSLENVFHQMLGKNGSQIEELQREFRKLVEGKKYLLVLDDVWTENRDEWGRLKVFLDLGRKGSRILVTSRSRKVARVLEDDLIYELKGLSEDDSWDLFKKFAFRKGHEPMNNDDHLFDVSREILKKCANVPLALRVVGSMLYEQDESKWLSLQTANLANIGQGEEGIIRILKFSYYELSSALKSCFSYCALFPKDYVIKKEKLIRLWLVHGCLDQPHDCRNEEDVGEEYFCTLLSRCFLQDVTMDECGEIISCKMHDLIHDLAQEVAGNETIMLDSHAGKLDRRNRHLSLTWDGYTLLGGSQLSEMNKLRTFLHITTNGMIWDLNPIKSNLTAICFHFKRVRVLDLSFSGLSTLPDEVGNLSHLRCLDLSGNHELSVLPNSITKLYNLQVLNLDNTLVRKLPWNMKKLVNLRHLIFPYYLCQGMPKGMDRLTCLRSLSTFIVEKGTSKQGNKLTDLKALVNLRGDLTIKFPGDSSSDVANYRDVELIRALQLKKLRICTWGEGTTSIPETLLASLQPHNKLKVIEIDGYNELRLPTWVHSLTTSLPNLVEIQLWSFDRLEMLPSLSQLHHLKCLSLWSMLNVEFMEGSVIAGPSDDELLFFPSLEKLRLWGFPKLKGWWGEEISRGTGEVEGSSSMAVPSFPSLLELILRDCPSLATFPCCPKLINLELIKCHGTLTFFENKTVAPDHPTTGHSSSLSSSIPLLYLDRVTIDDIGMLACLFGESLGGTRDLVIQDFEGESLWTSAEKCVEPVASIQSLQILRCPNLKSLSGVAKHFTSLQTLSISNCENLQLGNNEEATMTTLESLYLSSLPKLVNLPVKFQYLTTLQCMWINYCENLESLPEWINCLTSLQTLAIQRCHKLKSLPEAIARMPALQALHISGCDKLKRRCREPDGEDWPNVRHIPCLDVR